MICIYYYSIKIHKRHKCPGKNPPLINSPWLVLCLCNWKQLKKHKLYFNIIYFWWRRREMQGKKVQGAKDKCTGGGRFWPPCPLPLNLKRGDEGWVTGVPYVLWIKISYFAVSKCWNGEVKYKLKSNWYIIDHAPMAGTALQEFFLVLVHRPTSTHPWLTAQIGWFCSCHRVSLRIDKFRETEINIFNTFNSLTNKWQNSTTWHTI